MTGDGLAPPARAAGAAASRPKRSACSTTITVAFGTSIPTSTTVVATSRSISPRGELPHDPVLRVRRHPAVQQAHAERREDVLRQVIGHLGGGRRSTFSDSSTSG